MTAAARKLATLDDLFAIPEDERRHELVEGSIVVWFIAGRLRDISSF